MMANASLHLCRPLEVPVGAALAAIAEIVDGALVADRGDDILQHATRRHVIKYVAGGERPQAETERRNFYLVQPESFAGATLVRQTGMAALAEDVGHPAHRGRSALVGHPRHQRADQPLGMVGDVFPMQEALPL